MLEKKYTATDQMEWVSVEKKIYERKKIYRFSPKGVSEWTCNLFPEKKNIRYLWYELLEDSFKMQNRSS